MQRIIADDLAGVIPIKSPKALGVVLRHARTAQHVMAADLAEMVGTSAVTLRRFEQGNPTAAITTLFALLDELGLWVYISFPSGTPPIELPAEPPIDLRTRASR